MSEAPDNRLAAAVESLLFASPEPLAITKIAEILEVAPEDVTLALGWLTNGAFANRGVQVVAIAGGYQMVTNPDFAPYIGRLLAPPPPRLSRAAMETLAIIAYRQPCTLPEIEAIRGVDATGVVKTLVERGMVQDVGKKDTVGHPTLYATTSSFLKHFGLNSVEDLPPLPDPEAESADADGQLRLVEAATAGANVSGLAGSGLAEAGGLETPSDQLDASDSTNTPDTPAEHAETTSPSAPASETLEMPSA